MSAMPTITKQSDTCISKFLPPNWGPWLPAEASIMDVKPDVTSRVEHDTKQLLDECVVLSGVLQAEINKATKQLS